MFNEDRDKGKGKATKANFFQSFNSKIRVCFRKKKYSVASLCL